MSRILLVEDEIHLAEGLRFNLEAEGHSADLCADGEAAVRRLVTDHERFDAVVLDVMLPGMDGFAVASALRKAKNYVPVLILTARSRPEDVLEGFAAGADDYLAKPFELPIFLARLQGLLRRSAWQSGSLKSTQTASSADTSGSAKGTSTRDGSLGEVYSFNGKTLDFDTLELHSGRNPIQLTLMEATLL
ncbi:MAG: response regulator transcription factor, partial [Terracidiphilus sp.]